MVQALIRSMESSSQCCVWSLIRYIHTILRYMKLPLTDKAHNNIAKLSQPSRPGVVSSPTLLDASDLDHKRNGGT